MNFIILAALDFNAVKDVYEQALNDVADLQSYAMAIAGIGALLYICSKFWREWARGESIDFYGMLRPIAIGLCIINFSALPAFLEVCTSPLETVTKELREKKNVEFNEKLTQYASDNVNDLKDAAQTTASNLSSLFGSGEEIEAVETESSTTADNGSILTVLSKIYNIISYYNPFDNLGRVVNQGVMWIISAVAKYLCIAVTYVLAVLVYFTKILLVIIGPLVFALSIYPKFDGLIVTWFSRYINVSLWIPICNLIGYMMQALVSTTMFSSADVSGGVYEVQATQSNIFVAIIFQIVGLIMYCMVPRIAGWIIDPHGSDIIGSAVGRVASTGATAGASAAGASVAKSITKAV